jgi:hypothetical protein
MLLVTRMFTSSEQPWDPIAAYECKILFKTEHRLLLHSGPCSMVAKGRLAAREGRAPHPPAYLGRASHRGLAPI